MSARRRFTLALALLTLFSLGMGPCQPYSFQTPFFEFRSPLGGQLSETGDLTVELRIPEDGDVQELELFVDNVLVDTSGFVQNGRQVTGVLSGIGEGRHLLFARLPVTIFLIEVMVDAMLQFEFVSLENPDECEVLNGVECLLPYPSSHFQAPAATPTGLQLNFPASGMPMISGGQDVLAFLGGFRQRLDPTAYNTADGYSPTAQILMHFPQGVDYEASNVSRLQEDTRNFGLRSLEDDSPTVLIDATTGERVAHFVEPDARASDPDRQVTFLRPAISLLPGHRYIVAVRRLLDPQGVWVTPEPAFSALRDGRPTTVPAIEARREDFEDLFFELGLAGVKRQGLVLAFDFVVASDQDLSSQLLTMRDDSFEWLATQTAQDLITVTLEEEVTPAAECAEDKIWKIVEGTFSVPLYLVGETPAGGPTPADPILSKDLLGFLNVDANGTPVTTGTVEAPFGAAIPCSVLSEGPAPGLVFGHGLFGNGPGTVRGIGDAIAEGLADLKARGLVSPGISFDYVVAGTNWSGLSSLEVPPLPSSFPSDLSEILNDPVLLQQIVALLNSFIGQVFLDFNVFDALPDRLRQGMLNTLVLAYLMDNGAFNEIAAFQPSVGAPAIDDEEETYYFGASLGGIMGTQFLALSPNVRRGNVDVPGINFGFLLQRAKPFSPFQSFLDIVENDKLTQALGLSLLHERWVRGEPACCAHHITGNTLPPFDGPDGTPGGTGAKQVLMTVALYDQQVANLAAQISAATLGLPNLDGSILPNLPLLPDQSGPTPSAHVVYDTGSYVLGVDDQFIPPLSNQTAPVDDNQCDPHGLRGFIPASLEQLVTFSRPTGLVENFCNGLCDAAEAKEIPAGDAEPCDPNS